MKQFIFSFIKFFPHFHLPWDKSLWWGHHVWDMFEMWKQNIDNITILSTIQLISKMSLTWSLLSLSERLRDRSVTDWVEELADRTGGEEDSAAACCCNGWQCLGQHRGHQYLIVLLWHLLSIPGYVAHLVVRVHLANVVRPPELHPADEQVSASSTGSPPHCWGRNTVMVSWGPDQGTVTITPRNQNLK